MTTFYDLYVFSAPDNCPATLHQQCFDYILMGLDQLPFTSLALLPLKTRQQLLWSLPIADVCLLEVTQFTKGMNMADYWSAIIHIDVEELGRHSECLDCRLENKLCSPCRWKTIIESTSAKEWVYAVIAAEAITNIGIMERLSPNNSFKASYSTVLAMTQLRNCKRDDLYTFLYATRKFYESDSSIWCTAEIACRFEFPQRYKKYADAIQTREESCQFYLMNAAERKFLLDAIVCCFGERKPRVLSTHRSLLCDISEEISDFLSDLKFFTCQIIEPFEEIPSLETALEEMAGLEVLHLQNGCDRFVWSSVSLDSLFGHIANQPFLSSINILAVSEGYHSYFEVSKDVLYNLKWALNQRSKDCNHHLSIQAGGLIILKNGKKRQHLDFTTIYNFCKKCPLADVMD